MTAAAVQRAPAARAAAHGAPRASRPTARPRLGGGPARRAAGLRGLAPTPAPALRRAANAAVAATSSPSVADACLPRTADEMVAQAAAAAAAARAAGRSRQRVDFLLPIDEKEKDFTATEADDYPSSLMKEFDVACALTTALLRALVGDASLNILSKRLDASGETDQPCAVLYPEGGGDTLAAVVYPTADRLKQIRQLEGIAGRALLLVNPQWREEGQVVSDFGIGPWKVAALSFLDGFERSYSLRERRVGNPGTVDIVTGTRFASGGVLRVRRAWPGGWEAHACAADGSSQLLGAPAEGEPSYKELEAALEKGRRQKLPIFRVARLATRLGGAGEGEAAAAAAPAPAAAEVAAAAGGGGLTRADLAAMDAAALRRRLAAAGAPTSGRLDALRERLAEALEL